jgi:FkbM family methyltransferase
MPSRSWPMGERILRWSRNGEAKLALSILKRLPPQQRAHAVDVLLNESLLVETSHGGIRFLNHSRGSCKRALTLLTKEPDSLKWIDAMRPGSVFWDIGANVGVLTLYAASRGDLDVWAFEPAAVNYYNLVANCELNGLERHARCLQLGFSDTEGIADLHVSQFSSAHSFTFRRSTKPKVNDKSYPSIQAVQLCTVDDFIARYRVACPNYIKIDVPGLTPEILIGAQHTLSQPALWQVQVEAREHRSGGRRIAELLSPFGFKIVDRGMKRGGQGDLVFSRDPL